MDNYDCVQILYFHGMSYLKERTGNKRSKIAYPCICMMNKWLVLAEQASLEGMHTSRVGLDGLCSKFYEFFFFYYSHIFPFILCIFLFNVAIFLNIIPTGERS